MCVRQKPRRGYVVRSSSFEGIVKICPLGLDAAKSWVNFSPTWGGAEDQVRFYVPLTLRVALVVPIVALHDAGSTYES